MLIHAGAMLAPHKLHSLNIKIGIVHLSGQPAATVVTLAAYPPAVQQPHCSIGMVQHLNSLCQCPSCLGNTATGSLIRTRVMLLAPDVPNPHQQSSPRPLVLSLVQPYFKRQLQNMPRMQIPCLACQCRHAHPSQSPPHTSQHVCSSRVLTASRHPVKGI